jgi:hypothetical protein
MALDKSGKDISSQTDSTTGIISTSNPSKTPTRREGCTGDCNSCPHRGSCKLCEAFLQVAQEKEVRNAIPRRNSSCQ